MQMLARLRVTRRSRLRQGFGGQARGGLETGNKGARAARDYRVYRSA
jgi:hypothetical protein